MSWTNFATTRPVPGQGLAVAGDVILVGWLPTQSTALGLALLTVAAALASTPTPDYWTVIPVPNIPVVAAPTNAQQQDALRKSIATAPAGADTTMMQAILLTVQQAAPAVGPPPPPPPP